MLSPNFLTIGNLLNLLQQASIPGIVAIGMTVVIIIGGIDLSVGSVAAFAGMISAILISKGMPAVIAVLAGVLLGAALGLITGILISKFGLPDFIATLAMMEIARGAALLTTEGVPVFGLPSSFKFIGGGFIGKVSVSGIIWIILTVVFALMLKYTSFGRSLYAIGGNREAAMLSGIKTTRNYAIAYVLSACLAAFSGVLTASWLATGQPTACDGMELNAIAASVIGGASLAGGIGSVVGTFGGVFLLQIITNIFNLVGLASFYQQIAKGVIIIAALLLNRVIDSRE
nr:ABC transporter permease [uncultured Blautia sp.]